jgi:hypothetical protein
MPHRFTSASKPAAWKGLIAVSATFTPPFQPLRHQRNIWHPVVNRFTRQTLPAVNRKHFFINILWIVSFYPQKTQNITLLFVSILLKRPNMRMHVCYLDCHETGLCCYLVIHIKNLLHPLQLFYFHLSPIY